MNEKSFRGPLATARYRYILVTAIGEIERKETEMSVKDYYGNDVNFEAAVELMDKDICEQLHDQMAPCTEQEFFDAYAKAHAEKFDGEEFAPYYNLAW